MAYNTNAGPSTTRKRGLSALHVEMNMDPEVQERLEEYGPGFEKISKENYLADKASRKDKSIEVERTELCDSNMEISMHWQHCKIHYACIARAEGTEAANRQRELDKLQKGKHIMTSSSKKRV
ncbi:hypothetical protein Hanom_Chr01g00070961 [Helianthus anomalus]